MASIQTVASLEIFDRNSQCAIGHPLEVDHLFLLRWLISRSQQVGVNAALDNLSTYLSATDLELTEVLAIDGFEPTQPLRMASSGIEVVPWSELENTDTKWEVEVRSFQGGPHPSAAILRRSTVPRLHLRPWEASPSVIAKSYEQLIDVSRCISVVAGTGVRILHDWVEPPDWAPWRVHVSILGVDQSTHPHRSLQTEDVSPTVQLITQQFLERDENCRTRLRIPMDRLNRSYLAGMRSVDVAIELGIALEATYAPDHVKSEISSTIRTRAARFFGGNEAARRATRDYVKNVYDLRSRAVHAGRFDADGSRKWKDSQKVIEALKQGQVMVGKTISRFIECDEPDWGRFDIS